jgi:hypothetical protein
MSANRQGSGVATRPGPSMPTMFGNTAAATPGDETGPMDDFDVNKLDSAALQDVIQYSGVDLKAEAEMIQRHDMFLSQATTPSARDPRIHHDYYFNSHRLKGIVSACVLPRHITDMSEVCLDMLGMAVATRLANVIQELVEISKHRVDWPRSHFKIKIDNDPKRQLWLVDQYLAAESERVKSGHGGLGTADALAIARAKMKKTERRAGEDVAVKTKLANVTAAVATGLQLKSWMTDPSALSAPPVPDNSNEQSGVPTKLPLHFSQAPSMTPISDRELQAQFTARTVTLKDLIYCAENDPKLRHSVFLLSLYNYPQQQ